MTLGDIWGTNYAEPRGPKTSIAPPLFSIGPALAQRFRNENVADVLTDTSGGSGFSKGNRNRLIFWADQPLFPGIFTGTLGANTTGPNLRDHLYTAD